MAQVQFSMPIDSELLARIKEAAASLNIAPSAFIQGVVTTELDALDLADELDRRARQRHRVVSPVVQDSSP